jgi:hypothetical protein
MLVPFILPFGEITFIQAPQRSGPMELSSGIQWLVLIVAILFGLALLVRFFNALRVKGLPTAVPPPGSYVLIDGSNVMHWKDESPQIAPVRDVVREVKGRGLTPGVVFDANAGWKLAGHYMNEHDFALLLGLSESQVFVVPKGTQADPYLLSAARDHGAKVVTRDRFRDWAKDHPEVTTPGFLIRGGYRSSGEFWLDQVEPEVAAERA